MTYVTIAVLLVAGFAFSIFGIGVFAGAHDSKNAEGQLVASLAMTLMSGTLYILAGYMMGHP